MARIRTIKPSFFTSLTIADLTPEQRLTFIGLWTHADDEGRCIYDPRLIKAALWPLDDRTAADVAADVAALTEASLITHYILSERSYLVINTWSEHQRINRPAASTLPSPDSGQIVPLTCSDESSLRTHGGLTAGKERKGREQGMEGKGVTLVQPAPDSTGFDEFWAAYPKRADKGHARTAWAKAVRKADVTAIIEGARRFGEDPNLPEPKFIPLAATWLNGERWDDGPLPDRRGSSNVDVKVEGHIELARRLHAQEQQHERLEIEP